MNASYDRIDNTVTVTLSERNVLALLAQLRDPDRPAPALIRNGDGEDEPTILVQAQPDDVHYGDREPGAMRPNTVKLMTEFE